MKKKLLSLALALVLCLSLAIPALAAAPEGETKVITDEEHGVVISMEGFLREETGLYAYHNGCKNMTFMVLADNSKVTVEAMEGRKYASTDAEKDVFYNEEFFAENGYAASETFAWSQGGLYSWYGEHFESWTDYPYPLEGPVCRIMEPSKEGAAGSFSVPIDYSVVLICESDFAKIKPFDGKLNAAEWTQETLLNASSIGLFPDEFNLFEANCSGNITRAEFAEVAVHLYQALSGIELLNYTGLSKEHPFTDVDRYNSTIGYAYNLGIVKGNDATHFAPDGTLTREQAVVMLARVYTKLYGDIPQATATSFADDDQVSGYAKSELAFMASKGIVNGVGGNRFAPKRQLSIQEAIVIAYRMYEKLQ